MQELRLVAVSEDGSYAVLTAPGSGGRFTLRIDDRLRIVARGQFSRLAQYEIEVESPLRPKEIQDRIRAGETAEEIADAAGVPDRARAAVRGPRAGRACLPRPGGPERDRAPVGDSGPGRSLGDLVAGGSPGIRGRSRRCRVGLMKRADGGLAGPPLVQFGQPSPPGGVGFDPHRKHVAPADDTAMRLCLPDAELPPPAAGPACRGTRHGHAHRQQARPGGRG